MNEFVHNDICVGIDLGTTNSLIATCRIDNGKIQTPVKKVKRYVDAISGGNKTYANGELLPSCVYYEDKRNGEYNVIVGDFAKKQYAATPYLVAKSIKSKMGEPYVEGLQEGIPDTTPEQISARILRHLLDDLELHYGEKINDVVITVPANFDPVKREATLRAAEIAGIHVRNADGTLNDEEILLSEPEAVMYDLINQIQKGDFDPIVDFTHKKRVLVFDIGGGTLDITLHTVEKNSENQNIYNIETIATNRYSDIAGDTFDNIVAQKMHQKCIEYYNRQDASIAKRVKEDKYAIPNFLNYAEELKIEISNTYFDLKQRGKELTQDREFEYGGIMTSGYSSADTMTVEEYEECVESLLGNKFNYNDYKNFDNITDNKNIIYPILNVLKKASEKLGEDEILVDAVILNGGMSRLYLIKKRLDQFFGFNIIVVSDPDKSVAQGATVYHYYLHQDASLMKKLHEKKQIENKNGAYADSAKEQSQTVETSITTSAYVLNESLYLGLKAGATIQLAKSGQILPYFSEIITGFKIEKGVNRVSIPIMQKSHKKDEYNIIASGDIVFKNTYPKDTPVSIKFSINKNQLLSFEAWTSHDDFGLNVIDKGSVSLTFGSKLIQKSRTKMVPPSGTKLIVANELASIKDLCMRADKMEVKNKKTIIASLIQKTSTIEKCGNPEEFAKPILELLQSMSGYSLYYNIIPMSRKISDYWSEDERHQLAQICLSIISNELSGFSIFNRAGWTNIYSEAIKTIGYVGAQDQIYKLNQLKDNLKYQASLLYAFAKGKTNAKWIYQKFLAPGVILESIWALGVIMQRTGDAEDLPDENNVVDSVIAKIHSGILTQDDLTSIILVLGLICDQRSSAIKPVCKKTVDTAKHCLISLKDFYNYDAVIGTEKACAIAMQLLEGKVLNANDELYLLDFLGK